MEHVFSTKDPRKRGGEGVEHHNQGEGGIDSEIETRGEDERTIMSLYTPFVIIGICIIIT